MTFIMSTKNNTLISNVNSKSFYFLKDFVIDALIKKYNSKESVLTFLESRYKRNSVITKMTSLLDNHLNYNIDEKLNFWFIDIERCDVNNFLNIVIDLAKEEDKPEIILFIELFCLLPNKTTNSFKVLDINDFDYFKDLLRKLSAIKDIESFVDQLNLFEKNDYIVIENSDEYLDYVDILFKLDPDFKCSIVTSNDFLNYLQNNYDENYELAEYIEEFLDKQETNLSDQIINLLIKNNLVLTKDNLFNLLIKK